MERINKLHLPEYICKLFDKYKYALLVCLAGILLAISPSCGGDKTEIGSNNAMQTVSQLPETETLERELEGIFSKIEGVGRVDVKLTVKSGYQSVYAYDKQKSASRSGDVAESQAEEKMVILSSDGTQIPVTERMDYPVFSGALVVCDGGDNAKVKLVLTEAVHSLTGITSDKIVISKMND